MPHILFLMRFDEPVTATAGVIFIVRPSADDLVDVDLLEPIYAEAAEQFEHAVTVEESVRHSHFGTFAGSEGHLIDLDSEAVARIVNRTESYGDRRAGAQHALELCKPGPQLREIPVQVAVRGDRPDVEVVWPRQLRVRSAVVERDDVEAHLT